MFVEFSVSQYATRIACEFIINVYKAYYKLPNYFQFKKHFAFFSELKFRVRLEFEVLFFTLQKSLWITILLEEQVASLKV
jgi:hypothetical protein